MPEVVITSPKNFVQIITQVEKFQNSHKNSWYRGTGDTKHKLSPSLFRHPTITDVEDIHRTENELSTAFEQRSPPFVKQEFKNEWDKMFFMQHYGIPTKLLDWTESPLIALYFALTACDRTSSGKPKTDAALWMLDPAEWNKTALQDISYEGGILDSNREQVKSYSPRTDLEERKVLPEMIYGIHNSPRIVAQRGMFALFGKGVEPMESYFTNNSFKPKSLHTIIIDKSIRDDVASSLFRKGVSDSTIYPDLHGLSLELRRSFGFWL